MKPLPQNIKNRLNNSIIFNKFGIVNLNALKAQEQTDLTKEELKEAINKEFAHEFVGNHIEFIEK